MNDNYKIELDLFSGQPNPSFQITRDEFNYMLNEINKLEESEPAQLFDGLGFRGIVLSGEDSVYIQIQNKIIRMQTLLNGVKYFKSNSNIISTAVNLFKDHDSEGKYKTLTDKVINEYLYKSPED
ncbi:MAG: hypothetical protein IPL53_07020 [Ignavibacteria bacterium]|nr:hypothetical protein [Ignavibacteria bacterium]